MKFFDLEPGKSVQTDAPIKILNWGIMTNGNVRVWYNEAESAMKVAVITPSPVTEEQLSQIQRTANDYSAQQRKLERDMASGPGSKKK